MKLQWIILVCAIYLLTWFENDETTCSDIVWWQLMFSLDPLYPLFSEKEAWFFFNSVWNLKKTIDFLCLSLSLYCELISHPWIYYAPMTSSSFFLSLFIVNWCQTLDSLCADDFIEDDVISPVSSFIYISMCVLIGAWLDTPIFLFSFCFLPFLPRSVCIENPIKGSQSTSTISLAHYTIIL